MRGPSTAGKFLALFGHQFRWHVHQVFNGSRATFGIHRNAQGNGAQEGLGEGIPENAEITGFE